MKVYIRADASTQIGTGHVMLPYFSGRPQTFWVGGFLHFGCYPGIYAIMLKNKGFKVHRINEEVDLTVDYWQWLGENWMTDAIKTREIILNQAGVQSDISNVNTGDGISSKFPT